MLKKKKKRQFLSRALAFSLLDFVQLNMSIFSKLQCSEKHLSEGMHWQFYKQVFNAL